MKNTEIASLVKRYKDGEEEAFEELYSRLWSNCYYLALKNIDDPEEAKDIVQEAFLKAKTSLSQLKENVAFSAWLSRIVINLCMDSRRKIQKNPQVSLEAFGSEITEERREFLPDSLLADSEVCYTIAQFVQELPLEQRTATLLYYYNQMTNEEIAEIMDISVNAVKLKLSRARSAIKRQVLSEKNRGTFPLFGMAITGTPVLTHILLEDATRICRPEIKVEIWERLAPILAELTAGGAAVGVTVSAGLSATGSGVGSGITASTAAIAAKVSALVITTAIVIGAGVSIAGRSNYSFEVALPVSIESESIKKLAINTEISMETSLAPKKSIKVLEDILPENAAVLVREWSVLSGNNRHKELLNLVETYGFSYGLMYISFDEPGGMYVLYSLEKEDKRLLLCEYYSVGKEEWMAVWQLDAIENPLPESEALEEWFWQIQ